MLSDNAKMIYEKYYRLPEEKSPRDVHKRVAKAISNNEKEEKAYFKLLEENKFRPNTPCMVNAGKSDGQLCACFLTGLQDSMAGINELIDVAIRIYNSGGGIGIPITNLREKGSVISTTNGSASGPEAVIRIIESISEEIKSGGKHSRAANLAVIRYDHPDILELLKLPLTDKIKKFNISVGVDKKFIDAVKENKLINFVSPKNGNTKDSIKAVDLFKIITETAWKTGDPGLVFLDTINNFNPLPSLGEIETVNVCGEVPNTAWTVCNLGSINIADSSLCYFYSNDSFGIDTQLVDSIHTATAFLDSVIDKTSYPNSKFKETTKKLRPIGLGFMGFADFLAKKLIPYDSQLAIKYFKHFCKLFTKESIRASINLVASGGRKPIKIPKEDAEHFRKIIAHYTDNDADILSQYDKYGIRNSTWTCIAPTGCQTKDTLIVTDEGILELQEIGNTKGDIWQDIHLNVSQESSYKRATRFFCNGLKEIRKIKLDSGIELNATPNHQFRILTLDNKYVWKQTKDMVIGDKIITPLNTYNKQTNPELISVPKRNFNEKEINLPEKITTDLAEFLGFFFANGSKHEKGIRLHFNSNEKQKILYYETLVKKLFNITPYVSNRNNCTSLEFASVRLLRWLTANDLMKQKAKTIELPITIRMFSKECLISFITAYWDADGSEIKYKRYKNSQSIFYIDTASKKLSQQLGIIIRAIGFDVKISTHTSGFGSTIYRVRLLNTKRQTVSQEDINTLKDLNLNNCVPDEIRKISIGYKKTYDIEVPENQCYIANSAMSHNTSSISCDCHFGWEAYFSLLWEKTLQDSQHRLTMLMPTFEDLVDRLCMDSFITKDKVIDDLKKNGGSLQRLSYFPEKYRSIFKTAHEIPINHKIEMQAAGQRYISQAISSTINLPNNAKQIDVSDIFLKAYELGLKGITVFRDGCKDYQVVNFKKPDNHITFGKTIKVKTPSGTLKIIGEYTNKEFTEDSLCEIALSLNSSNVIEKEYITTIGELLSLMLYNNIPLNDALQILMTKTGDKFWSNIDKGKSYQSILSAIGTIIYNNFNKTKDKIDIAYSPTLATCPECGGIMESSNGCKSGICNKCGYSKCG